MSASRELISVYKTHLDHQIVSKGDASRLHKLRPSQLPFCPVDVFVRHASQGLLRLMDMRGAFYTSLGTEVHTVVQTYLGPSGRFLANWTCVICAKKHLLTLKNECCDFPMKYHEIEISYKGIVGHIDAVFRDSGGNYWIVDFKTTSVDGIKSKKVNPGRVYREQVEAYALLLWLQHGIKVKGVMLMFILRDTPKDPVIWMKELKSSNFEAIKARLIGYKKMHREVMAVETAAEAVALARYGKCKNPWCKSCTSPKGARSLLKAAHTKGIQHHRLPLTRLS